MSNNLDILLDGLQRDQADNIKVYGAQLTKARKALATALADGQIGKARQALAAAHATLRDEGIFYDHILRAISDFDLNQYLATQFESALFAACRAADLPLTGRFPSYAASFVTLEILPDLARVELNGKRIEIGRVSFLVAELRKAIQSMEQYSIKPEEFAVKLVMAYDQEASKLGGINTSVQQDILLTSLYQHFVSDSISRAKYSYRQFGYDISRMLGAGFRTVQGRRVILNSGRDYKHAIQVWERPDQPGSYVSLSLVRKIVDTAS
jgi:hypothetical protein